MTKRRLGNALGVFKENLEMPDSECTLDYVLNRLVIWGGVETVAEKILALRKEIGPFGTLLYCGHDWVDPVLARHSMELLATEVMPRVNRELGESPIRV
jgi:alkanesulfonate monooxygenase SsuD/methylene tetrahydromethanopterin reductase-like flavin-dependent oxidoreductase (luciferase family)